MDINGVWVGYGSGDVDAEVEAIKKFLVGKFAYAAAELNASLALGGAAAQTYDQAMVDVVTKMQTAYGANTAVNPGLVVNGIMNFAWQVRSGFVKPPKIVIFTWQGTGVDMWNTASPQPYGAAQYVEQMFPDNVFVQPVGNYPAAVVPMGPSVNMGVSSAVSLLGGAPPISPGDPVHSTGPIILFGYSQGAICATHLYRDHIANPSGELHHRLSDVKAAVTFGNPCRAPGVANGNKNSTMPEYAMPPKKDGVVTGGISGKDNMHPEQVPDWWYDYVWLGTDGGNTELYTQAPVGTNPWTDEAPAGKVGTSIYNVVQQPTFGDVLSVALDLFMPLGTIEEIYNGLTFAGAGIAADHYDYNWLPAIVYLQSVVRTWVNNYVTSGGAIT